MTVASPAEACLSVRGLRWQSPRPSPAWVERIAAQHGASAADFAAQRFHDAPQAEAFFALPDYNRFVREWLPQLTQMKDFEAAANRIADAVEKGETIGLSGDYDCDGNCSLALMLRFLLESGVPPARLLPHIPHRMEEGYGVNEQAVDEMLKAPAHLLITLDNGTMAHQPIQKAIAGGMAAVVIDHHGNEKSQPVPNGALVVNPNRFDDSAAHAIIGARDIAAVGMTFLICLRASQRLQERGYYQRQGMNPPDAERWLGLVALASIGDVVNIGSPINRFFASAGLALQATAKADPYIKRLCETANCPFPPKADHVAFRLAPIINADGRLGQSSGWLYLSGYGEQTQTPQAMQFLMQQSVDHNEQRKTLEANLSKEAIAQARDYLQQHPDAQTLIVAGEGWHPGLIGIVAGRLKEQFHRPVVVAAIDTQSGLAKCSARSLKVEGYPVDIGTAFRQLQQEGVLLKAGGHPMAAGATFASDKLDDFRSALEEKLGEASAAAREHLSLPVDGVLNLAQLKMADIEQQLVPLLQRLEQMAPFGEGNRPPRIELRNVMIPQIDALSRGKHLRLQLRGAGWQSASFEAMAFHAGGTALEHGLRQATQPVTDPVSGAYYYTDMVGNFSLNQDKSGRLVPVFHIEDIRLPSLQNRHQVRHHPLYEGIIQGISYTGNKQVPQR